MQEYKSLQCFPIKIGSDLAFCTNDAKIYTTDRVPFYLQLVSELDTVSNSDTVSSLEPLYGLETVSKVLTVPGKLGLDSTSKKKFLVIEIWTQLDDGDTGPFNNAPLYIRPSILIILSIISYLLDHPLTIYEMCLEIQGIASPNKKPNEIKISKFVHDEVDKSSDLFMILEAVYKKEERVNEFVISLLSRWHKARYLEEESDASLYHEESFLVYFHIIELCSSHYSNQQSKEAEEQIHKFTRELLSTTFKLRDNQVEEAIKDKYKAVRSILLPDGKISITSKICYFLDRVKLLNIKTQFFVEQLVKIRNAIAHGRFVNHKTVNWPLPPFFSINGDVENFIFDIRIFTACLIGAYLSLEIWRDKWADVHSYLDMPPEYVKKFISDKSFEFITPTDFLKGTINSVRPSSLVKQFLLKRIKFQYLEIGLRSLMLNVEVDEESAYEIFHAAIVLADSLDKQLSDRCRSIVVDIHENKLVFYLSIRHILRQIEQQGVNLIWFREWIETGDPIS